ncbi:MAG: ADP-ribosylglycohydrolase family protein [Bacillati bacterium ANGP1]|uniref:ADP-ribosylglycohydrolase family protein n=1 Tax=Candidatus Segetimicrobium genomatis TaxID=2569760 RepID=A0A537JPZ9_9BACT|nr:MAG: ADP-ribosylglycohydrolase family protein [Terrabacteria group bacterium ANGP1]
MMHYRHIETVFGTVQTVLPRGAAATTARFEPGAPAGQVTDDTRLRNLLCSAIIRAGGRVTADDWASTWLTDMDGWFFTPVVNAYHKVFMKDASPREAGRGSMGSNSTAMSIAPVGLVNACDPRQAALDAYNVAGLVHEGYARDAACAVAAAVAEATRPDATVALARSTGRYEDFRQAYYETKLLPWPQNGLHGSKPAEGFYDTAEPRETIPAMFALFALGDGRFKPCLVYAVNFGRDADTLASILGSVSGALCGARDIPNEWIERVEANNPVRQRTLADGLLAAVRHEFEASQARQRELGTLLGQ